MHHQPKNVFFYLMICLVALSFSASLWGQLQNLEIHYINVQQGQSTLIIGPDGTTILLDGGYETKGTTRVVPYLQSLGINTSVSLDYIIASHRDTDHYVGLTEVINYGYDALHIYDNGSDKTNTYVEAFLTAAGTTTAGGVTPLAVGTVINLGDGATATCVAANGSVIGYGAVPNGQANENDRSICLLIKYNNFDFLIGGDMGGGEEDTACTDRSTSQINMETPTIAAIMPAGTNPMLSQYGVEVLHVSHHGSESSTNSDYMNISTPMIGCISVGDGQATSYQHPRIAVVDNVLLAGGACITAPAALVLQTEEGNPTGASTSFSGYCVGNILISTDGDNSYTVSADGAVSQGPDERTAAGLPATYSLEEYTASDNAPIIYSVHDDGTTFSSTQIKWSTNEPGDSEVWYGTTSGSYPNMSGDNTQILNHQISLSSLTESTTYFYVVKSTDGTAHETTSPEYSFTTASTAVSGVRFSEVFYDTPGTDSLEEWIELSNSSSETVDISGYQITDNNGSGGTYTIPAGNTMAPNSKFTIAVNSGGFTALYGYAADIYGSIPGLNNDGDALILKDSGGVEIDAVAWEGGASAGVPTGWGSDTLPSAPTGSTIFRTDVSSDTDTYLDWDVAGSNGNPEVQPVIEDTITVTAPNGGESWVIGSSHDVSWTSTGTVGNVNIDYSIDSGSNWTSIISSTENDGLYSWTIPDNASTTCLVRVQEADGSPTDDSDAVFSIITTPPPGNVVISEVYYDTIGTDSVEEWIELYNKSGTSVDISGWTITDNYPAGGHITIPASTTMAPYSYLTVAANSGGFNNLYGYDADYYYGTAVALGNSGDALVLRNSLSTVIDVVSWEGGTSEGLPTGWGSTTLPTASTGSSIVRSDVNVDTDTYADWTTASSNGNPQVQPVAASITVTSPNGGESWTAGTEHEITWTTTGTVGNVDILYSYDGGTSWPAIVSFTENDGSFLWTVPDTPSNNCFVRIQENDGDPGDNSDAAFTIESAVIPPVISGTILYDSAPLEGVVMSGLPGSPVTDAAGFYTASVDNDWSGTVTPTLAGYVFTPASRTYSNVTSDQTGQDYTAALAPSLELTCPNGWEHWTLGSTKSITWNAINYTGTVRIVLFKNGVRFGNIATGIDAATGSFSWTVGLTYDSGMATEGSDYRLYLRSQDNTIVDPSDYRLGLIEPAQLEVTSPNGGESWELGTTQNITWNASGDVETVRIVLFQKASKIGQIIANLPADQGSYAWTVGTSQAGVAPAGINYSIRLISGDGSQDDFSDGPLTLTESEALIVDHQHTTLNTIPSQWLDQASREKLLVLSPRSQDSVSLGMRLLGKRDSRLAPALSASELGLVLREGTWLPQGANLDLQEWRWSLEKAILESQATVAIVRPDEQALLAGRLNAESYLQVMSELAERLPQARLICTTVGMDEPNDILVKFNRQVRESVLLNKGVLLDIADIESWRNNQQQLENEVPVCQPDYRDRTGISSNDNLINLGSAAWWLLARLSGWEGERN